MKLSIVIVHYKTLFFTDRCIASILNCKKLTIEIIVVDNNSCDNSKSILTKKYPQLVWISSKLNIGFGRGCNLGMKASKNQNILLLNSDAIVNEKAISESILQLNSRERIGMVGCQIRNEDGTKQNYTSSIACFYKELSRNLIIDKIFPNLNCEKKAIMGSFMMIKKDALKVCGYFDPNFFLYSEEIELCNRFILNDFEIIQLNSVFILHKNNGSIQNNDLAFKQAILSKYLLYLKVRGYSGYFGLLAISCLTEITNLIFMFFISKQYRLDNLRQVRLKMEVLLFILKIPFIYSKKYNPFSSRILKLRTFD